MANVHFDSNVGGDGLTVSDDAHPDTGLMEYGWTTRFVPALSNLVKVAHWTKAFVTGKKAEVEADVAAAAASAEAAEGSALTAKSAAGIATTAATEAENFRDIASTQATVAQSAAAQATAVVTGDIIDDETPALDRVYSSTRVESRMMATQTSLNESMAQVNEAVTALAARGKRCCQVFLESGVWTPPEGVKVVEVLLVGGGGGGAGSGIVESGLSKYGRPGGDGGKTAFLNIAAQGGQGGHSGPDVYHGPPAHAGGNGGGNGGGKGGSRYSDKLISGGIPYGGLAGIGGLFSHGGGGGATGYNNNIYFAAGDGCLGKGAGGPLWQSNSGGGGSWGDGARANQSALANSGGGGGGSTVGQEPGGGGGGGEVIFMEIAVSGNASVSVTVGAGGIGGDGYSDSYGRPIGKPGGSGGSGMAIIYWWE